MRKRAFALAAALVMILALFCSAPAAAHVAVPDPALSCPAVVYVGQTVTLGISYGFSGLSYVDQGTAVHWTMQVGTRQYAETSYIDGWGEASVRFEIPETASDGTQVVFTASFEGRYKPVKVQSTARVQVVEFAYATSIVPRDANLAPGQSLDLTANLLNVPAGCEIEWLVEDLEQSVGSDAIDAYITPSVQPIAAGGTSSSRAALHLVNPNGRTYFGVTARVRSQADDFSVTAYPPSIIRVVGDVLPTQAPEPATTPTPLPTVTPPPVPTITPAPTASHEASEDLIVPVAPDHPAAGITVAELLAFMELDAADAAILKDGVPVASSQIVATGMVLQVGNNAPSLLAVRGDVLGNGRVSLTQLVRLARAVNSGQTLEGAFAVAGDLNQNGRIDLSDLVMLCAIWTDDAGQDVEPLPIASAAATAAPTVRPSAQPTATSASSSAPSAGAEEIHAACMEAANVLCDLRMAYEYPQVLPTDLAMQLAAERAQLLARLAHNQDDELLDAEWDVICAQQLPGQVFVTLEGGRLQSADSLEQAAQDLLQDPDALKLVKQDVGARVVGIGVGLAQDSAGRWWQSVLLLAEQTPG